jgi:diguanylate cyclase (GGDEF)-like protein
LRRSETFAIAVLDLNGFKSINDAYGHDVGDALLREVGDRLKSMVREEDTVARFGGDEFVLLLSEVDRGDSAEAILDRISASLQAPVVVLDHQIVVTCSCGIARFPHDGTSFDGLIKAADVRLYAMKVAARKAELGLERTLKIAIPVRSRH